MQCSMKKDCLLWVSWSIGHGRKICRIAYWCASLLSSLRFEPQFVNLLRSPGIDSQPGGPVQQPYLPYGPPGYIGWRNQFLDFLYINKFGLWVQLTVQKTSEFWEYMLSRVNQKDCTVHTVRTVYSLLRNNEKYLLRQQSYLQENTLPQDCRKSCDQSISYLLKVTFLRSCVIQ